MIDQAEALTRILARVQPVQPRRVSLEESLGCFLAGDVTAKVSLPSFDNSAMDGYAVVARSCNVGARLRVIGEQPAGVDRNLELPDGAAIRIFTGAPMPRGADAVVMQEDVERDGDEIVFGTDVQSGEFVRRCGGDVAKGQKILSAGEQIRPEMIALLAAQGIGSVEVGGEVTAAIISTGDELIAPGGQMRPGQIYDSNTPLLQTMLGSLGVRVRSLVHCPDEAEPIEAAVRAGAGCDLLIISGGVSVGARDLVKPALLAAGAQLDLWRVAVKPGKPFLFGHAERCAIFGLPGNPVSAFVTLLLFVRPAILRLMGANDEARELPRWTVSLGADVHNDGDRPHYMRGALRDGRFMPAGLQQSHALFGLSRSNALLLVQPGAQITAGEMVTVFTW